MTLKLPVVGPDVEVAVNMGDGAGGGRDDESFLSPITSWNTIQRQLQVKLMLPLFVVLLSVAYWSNNTMMSSTKTWADPVRDVMIEEELRSLNTRLHQRSESLRHELVAGKNVVRMVKSYWVQLLDGTSDSWNATSNLPPLMRGAGENPTYFSPYSAEECARGAGIDALIKCGMELSLVAEETTASAKLDSYEDRMISVEASALFRPRASLADKKLMPTGNDQEFRFESPSIEVAHLADLDNVMRVAYFSKDVTSVYVGVHSTETFKLFPFENLASYTGKQICDSKMDRPEEVWEQGQAKTNSAYKNVNTENYSPVCRPWYQRAQRNAPKLSAGSSVLRGDVVS